MDLKEHILTETDGLFCQYGIKSVTMDDIAKHLGMSKKTIYMHFQDKDELVFRLISNRMEQQNCIIEQNSAKAENAVHEFMITVTEMQAMLSNMNPMLFYDLQKYHPEAWLIFKGFKEKKLYQVVMDNLKRGIAEGLYRKNLNLEILTKMRVDQVDYGLFQNAFGSKFGIVQVMTELTEHFMYGLCTMKGHELINKYKNYNEE